VPTIIFTVFLGSNLQDMLQRRDEGKCSPFERIVIETSGLADPAPILQTLMTDTSIAGRLVLAGVVATVDTVTGARTLQREDISQKQVAIASGPSGRGVYRMREPMIPVNKLSTSGIDEHWHKCADEARSVADDMKDEISKQMMLQIADDYERLAKRAAHREPGGRLIG
jgi:hypothetical protein